MLSVGLPGDFDNDGDVDGRDFLVWQRDTSVGELADWQENYGARSLSASFGGPSAAESSVDGGSPVPEPTMLNAFLVLVAPLLGGMRVRHERKSSRGRSIPSLVVL